MDSKHKMPMHQRLFLTLFLFFFLFLLLFLIFQVRREKDIQVESLNQQLQIFNRCFDALLVEGCCYEDAAQQLIPKEAGDHFEDLRITVVDTTGRVLYDTQAAVEGMSNHLDRDEIRQALREGEGFTQFRYSQEVRKPYFYAARSYDTYVVRMALPYRFTWPSVLWSDRRFIFFVLLVSMGFCFAIFFYTRRLGQNIERLQDFASRVQAGEDLSQVPEFSQDELGSISNQLIRMYRELKETREQQAVLKKQLTQNINHELKTPVTIIQGYLETIQQNPNLPAETVADFHEKCYAQANRLARLMRDIATITRMDEGKELIDKEPLSLNALIEEVFSDMQHRLQEQQFEVFVELPDSMTLQGNASLLDAVFRNLIDNALAYSGGSRIELRGSLLQEGEHVTGYRFVFSDNGIGIPEQHLPRIFERFYRIDKGRSRKMGGTGLGLSIVRNAVVMHGGEISVARSAAGGAEFTFTFMNL